MYGVLTLSFLYKPLNGQRDHSANKYIRTLERKKKKASEITLIPIPSWLLTILW